MDRGTYAQDDGAPDTRTVSGVRESTTCARCGTTRPGLPLTWTCSMENGDREYFCDDCARANLQSIESRLDSVWW